MRMRRLAAMALPLFVAGVVVADYDDALRFYTDVLGVPEACTNRNADGTVVHLGAAPRRQGATFACASP